MELTSFQAVDHGCVSPLARIFALIGYFMNPDSKQPGTQVALEYDQRYYIRNSVLSLYFVEKQVNH